MFFLVVPALIVVMIAVNLLMLRLPLSLIGLLCVVAASCIVWISLALQNLGDVTLELTSEELRVKQLVGSTSYSWSFIDEVKLVDPESSLSDSGRHDSSRAGIALFMRGKNNESRSEHAEPDAILISGTGAQAEFIVKVAERISAFKTKQVGVRGRKGGRVGQQFNVPRKGFRKTQETTA